MDISLTWRVYDKSDLFHYYTDGNGILSDKGIYEHTKLLLNDIKKIKNLANVIPARKSFVQILVLNLPTFTP